MIKVPICSVFFVLILVSSLLFCTSPKQKASLTVENHVLVHLQQKVKAERIQASFNQAYGLSFQCYADKEKRQVIFSFDDKKITQNQLIKKLTNEVGILTVVVSPPCKSKN